MSDTVASAGSFLNGVRGVEWADELGEYCGKVLAGIGADVSEKPLYRCQRDTAVHRSPAPPARPHDGEDSDYVLGKLLRLSREQLAEPDA